MRRFRVVFMMVSALLLVSALVWASPTKRLDPGTQMCRIFTQPNLWQGYEIYTTSCKSCHFTGNAKGASFLYTESKIMKGWNRVFWKKYPKCAKDGSWDNLTEEQLQLVNDYLYRYAADSYDPYDANDCG